MKKIIKYKPLIIGIFPILIIFLCRWYSNYFSLSFVLGPFIFCIIIIFSYLGTLFLLANSLNEFKIEEIYDIDGNKIDIVNHPKQIVKIKVPFMVNKLDMIRIKK